MKKQCRQQGFTLVELAIVLTIIGLLIGGILKGQQLMTNARVTATMAQVQAIESATTTFRDTYNAIPGDMPAANTRISNCGNCIPLPLNAGDGVVGAQAWDIITPQATLNLNGPAAAVGAETILYWAELAQAGLLSGITNAGITTVVAPTFGTSLPSARLGGGWLVGNSSGAAARLTAVAPFDATVNMAGLVLLLTPNATTAVTAVTGTELVTPTIAAQMDRKMDDGNPITGFSQAYGPATCLQAGPPVTYNEALNSKECGMIFRIQG